MVENSAYKLILKALLSGSVPVVSVDQLDEYPSAVFLDTRSKKEYAVSHIPGAHWVGYAEYQPDHLPADLSYEDTIIVYCSVGYRSEKIGEKLRKAGFARVYNLYGGIFEYVNRDGILSDGREKTRNIHPYNWIWGQWLQTGNKTQHTAPDTDPKTD